jgi:hypothetical protein
MSSQSSSLQPPAVVLPVGMERYDAYRSLAGKFFEGKGMKNAAFSELAVLGDQETLKVVAIMVGTTYKATIIDDDSLWKNVFAGLESGSYTNYCETLRGPVRLALDLEYKKDINPELNMDKVCKAVLKNLNRLLEQRLKIEVKPADWTILDASDAVKASRHCILSAKKAVFESHKFAVGPLIEEFAAKLTTKKKFGTEHGLDYEETRNMFLRKKEGEPLDTIVIDCDIYTKDRFFRFAYNTKPDSQRVLLPFGASPTTPEEKRKFFDGSKVCVTKQQVEAAKAGGFFFANREGTVKKEKQLGNRAIGGGDSEGREVASLDQVSEQHRGLVSYAMGRMQQRNAEATLTIVKYSGGERFASVRYQGAHVCCVSNHKHQTQNSYQILDFAKGTLKWKCWDGDHKDLFKVEALPNELMMPLYNVENVITRRMQENNKRRHEEEETQKAEKKQKKTPKTTVSPQAPVSWLELKQAFPKRVVLKGEETAQAWFDQCLVKLMNQCFAWLEKQKRILQTSAEIDDDIGLIDKNTMKNSGMNDNAYIAFEKTITVQTKKGSHTEVVTDAFSPATLWLSSSFRREYWSIVFDPASTSDKAFNLFAGWPLPVAEKVDLGLIQPILDHIKLVYASGDQRMYDRFMTFYAKAIREPAQKDGIALVLLSIPGSGKDIIHEVLFEKIFGNYYGCTNDLDELHRNFNWRFANKLLIKVNEVESGAGWKNSQKMKSLITDVLQRFEKKYHDSVQLKNFSRYIFHTNNPDAIHVEKLDRRFFCVKISDEKNGDRAYFDALLKVVTDPVAQSHFFSYLLNEYEMVEGMDLRCIPDTPWRKELKENTVTGFDKFIIDMCNSAMNPDLKPFVFIEDKTKRADDQDPAQFLRWSCQNPSKKYTYEEPEGVDEETIKKYTFLVPVTVVIEHFRKTTSNPYDNKLWTDDRIAKRLRVLTGNNSEKKQIAGERQTYSVLPAPSILKANTMKLM